MKTKRFVNRKKLKLFHAVAQSEEKKKIHYEHNLISAECCLRISISTDDDAWSTTGCGAMRVKSKSSSLAFSQFISFLGKQLQFAELANANDDQWTNDISDHNECHLDASYTH